MWKTPLWMSSIAAALLLAGAFGTKPALGGPPCKRSKFETKLVADACNAGGMAKAKDEMKKWVKQAKSKQAGLECGTCHAKMAPTYDLKPDGLQIFQKLGGK